MPAGTNIETLNNDIQNLIVATKVEASRNPHDASVQTRLKALHDLQGVVQSTSLPPDQLELIKNKVTELAAVNMMASLSQKPTPTPTPVPVQARPMPPVSVAPPPAPVVGNMTLDSLLGKGALATLLARQSATPQNSTPLQPPPTNANVAIRSPPPAHVELPKITPAPAATGQSPLGLLDQLRAAGLLPSAPPPAAPVAAQPASIIPPNIASLLASSKAAGMLPGFQAPVSGGINVAALRQP